MGLERTCSIVLGECTLCRKPESKTRQIIHDSFPPCTYIGICFPRQLSSTRLAHGENFEAIIMLKHTSLPFCMSINYIFLRKNLNSELNFLLFERNNVFEPFFPPMLLILYRISLACPVFCQKKYRFSLSHTHTHSLSLFTHLRKEIMI